MLCGHVMVVCGLWCGLVSAGRGWWPYPTFVPRMHATPHRLLKPYFWPATIADRLRAMSCFGLLGISKVCALHVAMFWLWGFTLTERAALSRQHCGADLSGSCDTCVLLLAPTLLLHLRVRVHSHHFHRFVHTEQLAEGGSAPFFEIAMFCRALVVGGCGWWV